MNAIWSLVVLGALTASVAAQTGNEPRNVLQLYGKQALQTIRRPDSVSAVLLDDRKGRVSDRGRQVLLTPEAQHLAVERLSTNAAYGWDVWKPCAPRYGSRLIFRRGSERVTVDFCFDCIILAVNPAARPENNVDFGPSRDAWLRLFKEQFPKDKTFKLMGAGPPK